MSRLEIMEYVALFCRYKQTYFSGARYAAAAVTPDARSQARAHFADRGAEKSLGNKLAAFGL